jgi:uncharacterized protein
MSSQRAVASAFNLTRNAYLATRLVVAATHWSRFRGLMGTDSQEFPSGKGLWIIPSCGVHTFGMRFPIDVAYLDDHKVIVHLEHGLKPWRVAAFRLNARSILELPETTLDSTGTSVGDQIKISNTPEERIQADLRE